VAGRSASLAIAPASLRVRRGRRVGNINALIGQPALAGSVLAGQPLGVGRLRPPRTAEPLSLRGIGSYFARPPRGGQPAWDRMRPAAIVKNYGPAGATRPNSGGGGAGPCVAGARSWSRSGTPCRLFGGSDDGRGCSGARQESASQTQEGCGPRESGFGCLRSAYSKSGSGAPVFTLPASSLPPVRGP